MQPGANGPTLNDGGGGSNQPQDGQQSLDFVQTMLQFYNAVFDQSTYVDVGPSLAHVVNVMHWWHSERLRTHQPPPADLPAKAVDISFTHGVERTLLTAAVENDRFELLQVLVHQYGATVDLDPAVRAHVEATPLLVAVEHGLTEHAAFLINNGASLDLRDATGRDCAAILEQSTSLSFNKKKELSALLFGTVSTTSISADVEKQAVEAASDPTQLQVLASLIDGHPQLIDRLVPVGDITTTLLFTAARANNSGAVETLIAKGANPNQQLPGTLDTPLHVACFRGYVESVEKMDASLAHRPDVLLLNNRGECCLSSFSPNVPVDTVKKLTNILKLPTPQVLAAIRTGNDSLLQQVLQTFPVDGVLEDKARGGAKTTMLLEAVRSNQAAVVRLLLREKADANGGAKVAASGSPIKVPTAPASPAVAPASPSQQQPTSPKPMRRGQRGLQDYQKLLEAKKAADDAEEAKKKALLAKPPGTRVALQQYTSLMEQQQSKSNYATAAGLPLPLATACELNFVPIAQLLLDFGADAKLAESALQGKPSAAQCLRRLCPSVTSPMEKAASFCTKNSTNPADLHVVLPSAANSKAHVTLSDPDEYLLVLAARSGNLQAVRMLLGCNANTEVISNNGDGTPVLCAAQHNLIDVVKELLQYNASLAATNSRGETVEMIAARTSPELHAVVAEVRTRRAQAHREQQLQAFVSSIPSRHYGDLVPQFNPSDTGDVERALLQAHAAALQREGDALLHNYNAAHGQRGDNPVTKELIRRAIIYAKDQSRVSLSLDNLLTVAPPELFPVPPGTLLTNCIASECAAIQDAVISELPTSIQVHVQQQRAMTHPFPLDGFTELYETIVTAVQSILIQELSALSCGRFKRSFLRDSGIPAALQLLKQQPDLLTAMADQEGVLDAFKSTGGAASNSTAIERLHIAHCDFQHYVDNTSSRWPNASHASISALIQKMVTSQSSAPKVQLNFVDVEVEKFTVSLGRQAVAELRKSSLSGERWNRVVKEHLDAVETSVTDDLRAQYKVAGGFLPASCASCGDTVDIMPTLAGVSLLFCDTNLLEKSIQSTINAPQQAQVTPQCQTRFLRVGESILAVTPAVTASVSSSSPARAVAEVFDHLLRPLHLHVVWRGMPIYEMMDDIEAEVTRNDVVLVEAETGSGKSVLLPQHFAFGGKRVHVTMPRRLPVLKTGEHVASIFGAKQVGFQCGGTTNPAPKAALQYCTDALYLNREFPGRQPTDPDIVVIDEIHERSAVMDMLYQLLLYRKHKGKTFKLVLASATVDKVWFESMAKSFGATFSHLSVPVPAPFPVTVVAARQTLQTWPLPSGKGQAQAQATDRADTAAKDAFQILKRDPNSKVLAFLPHISEVEDAHAKFKTYCGGTITSGVVHAKTNTASQVLQSAQVIFANQVAETSLTIDKLSHVLDFNLTMIATIDRKRNCRMLDIGLITQSSQKQRQGRLGRRCPGTYIHYMDLRQLPTSSTNCSYDLLLNDALLQMELRCNVFLKRSLFSAKDRGANYKTIGPGLKIANVPFDDVLNKLDAAAQQRGAELNFSPAMAAALDHSIKQKKSSCTLAILWLATMFGTREPPLIAGAQFDRNMHERRFGKAGDQGILLDVFDAYLHEAANRGSKFDSKHWCQGKKLNHYFWDNAASHMESVLRMVGPSGSLPLFSSSTPLPGYSTWQWDDIEDCLMAGYWHQTSRLVTSDLKDLHHKGPYMSVDSTQTVGLSIFNDSVFFGPAAGCLPDFVISTHSEKRAANGRRFLKYITKVSQAAVERWTRKMRVSQSIGLVGSAYNLFKEHFPNPTYANVTIVTDQAAMSSALRERTGNGFQYQRVEFTCRGSPLQVADAMESVATDIIASQQLPPISTVTPAIVKQFGTPAATLAHQRSVDPRIASRTELAHHPRSDADLKKALAGSDALQTTLAIINVLVNVCQMSIKGGAVRDSIVRGVPLEQGADIDCNSPSTLQQSSWRPTVDGWLQTISSRFGLSHSSPTARKSFAPSGEGIIVFTITTRALSTTEIEMVTPWNSGYIPTPNMDFSCNNLQLDPQSNGELRQCFPIMMTGREILQQLCAKPRAQTSPTRDCLWVRYDSSKHTTHAEGYNKKMYVESTTAAMQKRLDKFRNKGFHFVEQPHVSTHGSTTTVVLMHGTTTGAAKGIMNNGFKPSAVGNFGPGVYLSRDMNIVNKFANPVILQAQVDPGKLCPLKGSLATPDPNGGWRQNGAFDSALLLAQDSWRGMEEWIIWDPARIFNVKQLSP